MKNGTAIVTGASSGIGRATARELIQKGWRVYDFSRTEKENEGVTHVYCDVSDEESVKGAVEKVLKAEKRIDVLINCAGFGISGCIEFTQSADAKRLMNVNLMGTDNVVRSVLHGMRENGGGRIINISSMAAVFPIPFQAWYSASKAAINAYTLALINEVKPFGISACAVMPGDIRTGFTAAREKKHAGDDVYAGRITSAVSKMEKDEKNGMPSEKMAAFIARLAEKRTVKPFYTLGFSYRLLALLQRLLPSGLANFIVGKMYS